MENRCGVAVLASVFTSWSVAIRPPVYRTSDRLGYSVQRCAIILRWFGWVRRQTGGFFCAASGGGPAIDETIASMRKNVIFISCVLAGLSRRLPVCLSVSV